MVNNIIEAISISLAAEFHEKEHEIHIAEFHEKEHEVHIGKNEQDLKKPCFFIACLSSASRLFLGKRYFTANQFAIQYFPEAASRQRECHEAAERMMCCLEYITMTGDDKPIRGTDMRYEIIDGILNFFVNYDGFTTKPEQHDAMETLTLKTRVKEGD